MNIQFIIWLFISVLLGVVVGVLLHFVTVLHLKQSRKVVEALAAGKHIVIFACGWILFCAVTGSLMWMYGYFIAKLNFGEFSFL
jgi:hypothetical protein